MEWTNEVLIWILAGLMPVFLGICWPLVAIPWILYICWFIYTQFVHQEYVNSHGKVVYITGCDSGFGQAVALDLDLRGSHVFAGCLHPDQEGAQALKAQASDRLHVLDLDVTNADKVEKCAFEIEKFCQQNGLPGLWGLYNNAGVAVAGEIEWFSIESYQRSIDINLMGPIRVTKSVLPMVRNAKGRIVTVTSGIANAAVPCRSGYSLPKAALESFMDTLRYEMKKFGVKCCTINPGNFTGLTNIFSSVERGLSEQVSNMDARVKDAYGEQYINATKDLVVSRYVGGGSRVSMETVTASVRDALFLRSPRIRYKPAQFTWILWWFWYNLLPDDLMDLAMIWWQRNMPKPAQP